MRKFTVPLALAAAGLLVACNNGAANNAAGNATAVETGAANMAAPVAPAGGAPVAIGPAQPVDQAFVTGHWSPSPACQETISFEEGGVARVNTDARPGRWVLAGETLTVSPPEGPAQPTRVSRRGDALVVAREGGPPMTLVRCQAAAAPRIEPPVRVAPSSGAPAPTK